MLRRSLSLILLFGCSTTGVVLKRPELKDQVLRPRPGYVDHLTNQTCGEYKKHTTKCIKWDVVKYDMNDDAVRGRLRDLKFICNVNGERFRPCPTARGLCQQTIKTSGWINKKREAVLLKYISFLKDYQYMIDSKVKCASQDSAEGKTLFD